MYGTCFRVIRAINQAFDSRLYQRACAHGTRFNCNKEFTFAQTMVTHCGPGLAKSKNLGVGAGIAIHNVAVPSAADNGSVANYDRAHRDFAEFQCPLGGPESLLHPELILGGGRRYWPLDVRRHGDPRDRRITPTAERLNQGRKLSEGGWGTASASKLQQMQHGSHRFRHYLTNHRRHNDRNDRISDRQQRQS
jgi:hypothetical protein